MQWCSADRAKGGRSVRWTLAIVASGIAACVLLALPRITLAHEHRRVGPYEMTVGWAEEPTYAGLKNAALLILTDASGKPVTDLTDTLKVEVVFGNQKTGLLSLDRAWGKTFGMPGDYRAPIIPTRPGVYTFHFVGSISGQKVDQSFTASDTTFDPVAAAAAIEFPIKDPSVGELSGRLERLGSRIEAARSAARDAAAAAAQARVLAILGVVGGVAGIVVELSSRRGRVRA